MKKRLLSALLALTMLLTLMPTAALAVDAEGEQGETATETVQLPTEYLYIEAPQTSTDSVSMFGLGNGKLFKDGSTEPNWIDRIDLTDDSENIVKVFYDMLVEASDNDGTKDYLIEDKYFSATAENAGTLGVTFADGNISVPIHEETGTLDGPYSSKDDMGTAVNQEAAKIINKYENFLYAAYYAFDRDHPEVFWLAGSSSIPYSIGYTYSGQPGEGGNPVAPFINVNYTVSLSFMLKGTVTISGKTEQFDLRAANYNTEAKIKAGIKKVNDQVAVISGGAGATTVDKIQYFNKWLTENNGYNALVYDGSDEQATKDAWECISALQCKTGDEGPVCEAYARAFKVLCDNATPKIPCVLVDGTAKSDPTNTSDQGGPHMWNYAQVDGSWYGVDVTWNDPGKGDATNATSGHENDDYLLVGSDTEINNVKFITSHPVTNCPSKDTTYTFPAGPVLSADKCATKGAVTKIEVTTQPTKVEYIEGQTFDPTGMVLTVTYEDNSTETINATNFGTKGVKITPDPLTKDTTVVTISYGGQTTTFTVTVKAKEVTGIAVTKQPTKASYTVGETFSAAGLEVTATYDDGSTKVLAASEYKLSEPNMDKVGEQTITVTYGDASAAAAKTDTFKITISAKVLVAKDFAVTNNTATYDGQPHTATVTCEALDADAKITVTYDPASTNGPVDAGTYKILVTTEETTTYGAVKDLEVGTLTINKAAPTVTAPAVTIVAGSGTFSEPTVTSVNTSTILPGAFTYSYGAAKNADYNAVVAELAKATAGGTISYTFTPTDTKNYNTATGSFAFTVVNLEFFVEEEKITGSNAVTIKAAPTYGDTWASIVTLKEDLSAKLDSTVVNGTFAVATDDNKATIPSAGEHTVTVTFTGTETDSPYRDVTVCTFKVTVAPKAITPTIEGVADTTKEPYTGSQIKPAVTVKDGETDLALDKDYEVTYGENINVGNATVTVTGKGNYTFTQTITFVIVKGIYTPTASVPVQYVQTNKEQTIEVDLAPYLTGIADATIAGVEVLPKAVAKAASGAVVDSANHNGTKVTLNIKSVETAGVVDTIQIAITSTNYEDFNISFDVETTSKTDAGVTISGAANKTYGVDTTVALSGTAANAGETPVWNWTSSDTNVLEISSNNAAAPTVTIKGAGTAIITASYSSDTTIGSATVSITVAKGTITVTAANKTAYVGDAVPVLNPSSDCTITGVAERDLGVGAIPPYTGDLALAYASEPNMSQAGTVAIKASGLTLTSTNYETISYVDGTLTISTRGGGSSGGGSSSSTVKVPVSGDNNSVQVSASVSGTTATISGLDTKQLDTVAGDGGKTGMVEVDLTGLKQTIRTVELPTDTLKEIAKAAADENNGTRGLTIKLPAAEASFDAAALDEIQKQASSKIALTIAPASSSALNARQKEIVGNAPVFDLTMKSGSKTITDFGGGYATISVPYELAKGQDPAGIVVYYLDNSGNIHACETMYDVRTGRAIFTTGHLSLYFVGYAPENLVNFADVASGAYYYDAVVWAVANGITKGTSATAFSPDLSCTRAQTVTFLWRAAGSPAPKSSTNPFTDVKAGAYYYDAVLWAVEQGITKGTGADTFSPDATVTRGQTVTFLYRAAGSPAVDGSSSFGDVASDAYYSSAVQWAVANGITKGTSASAFSPDSDCTRAQIVTFLYRSQSK